MQQIVVYPRQRGYLSVVAVCLVVEVVEQAGRENGFGGGGGGAEW